LPFQEEPADKLLNNGFLKPMPKELANLSETEEMLISQVRATISVFVTRDYYRQRYYRGGSINFRQDIEKLCRVLPRAPEDHDFLYQRVGKDGEKHEYLRVSRSDIRTALEWLQKNNPFYYDIKIDEKRLSDIPEQGYYFDIKEIKDKNMNVMEVEPGVKLPTKRNFHDIEHEQMLGEKDSDDEKMVDAIADKDKPHHQVFVLHEPQKIFEDEFKDRGRGKIVEHLNADDEKEKNSRKRRREYEVWQKTVQ